MPAESVRITVDGMETTVVGPPDRRLVDILREDCGAMGLKRACDIGRCGACMVLIDGAAANACLVMAYQAEGAAITTPAGLDALPLAAVIRDALIEEVAFQCGYCAPGFTIALTALFLGNRAPDREAIMTALEGNICRCTGYHSILRGAEAAARKLAARDAAAEQGPTP
jgi:aerobic carbon-monoxide dehydrogenase small subunit